MTVFAGAVAPGLGQSEGSPLDVILRSKGTTTVSACIPARNEGATIRAVLGVVIGARDVGLVDEVLVIDDGSSDGTASCARTAGARVVSTSAQGKGGALRSAAAIAKGELLLFLDADVSNYSPSFLGRMITPLLLDPRVQLVKAAYRRSLNGQQGEGGRVTELVARPLLERFHPELATLTQPLAGESALRRSVLDRLTLAGGYGIEIGLLIDVYLAYGIDAITEAHLDERIHRNRPLSQLGPMARDVLDAVLDRPPSLTARAALP